MFLETIRKISAFTTVALTFALLPTFAQAQFQGGIGTIEPAPGFHHNYPSNHDDDPYGYQFDQRTAMRLTRQLYRAILFREADGQGLRGYSDLIMRDGQFGLERAAYEIATSNEYRINVERRYRPEQIVTNLYRVLLQRRPDSSGLRYYSQMLRQGRSGDALREIVNSPEFADRNL